MKHFIWIEVKTHRVSRFLLKLFKANIETQEIRYFKDGIQFKILEQDYKKLKKIVGYQYRKVSDDGIFQVKQIIKKKWLIFLGFLLFLLLVYLFSHVIVQVSVIHSNKVVRELVHNSLEDYGIKRFTWRKDYQAIEQIKEEVLQKYPKELEWIEIEVHGMRYVVRVEERIITEQKEPLQRCHLVASKSAIVKKMIYSSGEAQVSVNDFVSVGDILVSGQLVANEKLQGSVCATGEVYGEVWYTTHVTFPITHEVKHETGKKRWNFRISKGGRDTLLFRPRVESYVEEVKPILSVFGYVFSLVVQKEVQVETKVYTEEEALKRGMDLVDEKFQMKLLAGEEVLDKKVLKKHYNDSTMDIEIFVSVLEVISRQEEFQEIKEEG